MRRGVERGPAIPLDRSPVRPSGPIRPSTRSPRLCVDRQSLCMMSLCRGLLCGVIALSTLAPESAQASAPESESESVPAPLVYSGSTANDEVTRIGLAKSRRLLVSGGVVAGVGLLSGTLGFSVFGGIHAGNPGRGLSLEFDDPNAASRTLKLAKSMSLVGVVGASMLVSGIVVAAIGGSMRRRARSRYGSRITASPAGLLVSF